ncbi:histone acetyltransferase-like protein [Perkinsela sp. CCAP 1560/4]|nr:histone acetyltransferase-like protein [Perkinsela sp. CCAP 1560/4]|eukprot:KNH06082.1 histone acetyltransferase-like protein [Perkinsela sp. CCAP 1560/4]
MNETDIEEIGGHPIARNVKYLGKFDPALTDKKLNHLPTIDLLRAECDEFERAESSQSVSEFVPFVKEMLGADPRTQADVEVSMKKLRKKYKRAATKNVLLAAYRNYLETSNGSRNAVLENYLIKKSVRSSSGVLVITVFTSPYPTVNGEVQNFSCQWNCYYCPNEPGQPRSYLLNEPGVRRANMNAFDAVNQFQDRLRNLVEIGHEADKVEILVLGGTWESYPLEYQESFVRDLYYAANMHGTESRDRLTLFEEQAINTTTTLRIIGLTLETRPDTINPQMLHRLRRYGCTRVQVGVQHTDDRILKKINRKCYLKDFRRAMKLLKESCFKVDIHLMPDLPGATPKIDVQMFDSVLRRESLQADQWKIYPCQTTPWTVIKEWFERGSYVPYGLEGLVEVLVMAMSRVHPWIRLNRVIRDIPPEYVIGGTCCTNLRQVIEIRLREMGRNCACIRCREVKDSESSLNLLPHAQLVTRQYVGQGGVEYFLSFEDLSRQVLFGFLRLRLSEDAGATCFPELRGAAMIRELHVYGRIVKTEQKSSQKVQHLGFGKRLLEEAERISTAYGFHSIAVISGVGVRTYYHKRGYVNISEDGQFQLKTLRRKKFRFISGFLRLDHNASWLIVVSVLFLAMVLFLQGFR